MDLIDTAMSPVLTMAWLRLLVNIAIKGTVILFLAGTVTMMIRKSSASVKHLIWNLALGSILFMPVLSMVLPAWEAPVLPALTEKKPVLQQPVLDTASLSGIIEKKKSQTDERKESAQTPGSTRETENRDINSAFPNLNDQSEFSQSRKSIYAIHWSGRVLMVWVLGVLILSCRLLIGFVAVRRLIKKSRPATSSLDNLTSELASSLGLNRRIGVYLSHQITVPMTWGFVRPVILLPANFEEWPVDQRRIAMLHELAHAKRYDTITQLLMQVSCILHWFNPMAWFAIWQIHKHRERACDDQVLNSGTKASDYADHLLQIVRSVRSSRLALVTTVAMARRSQLEGRLLAILNPNLSRKVMDPLVGIVLILFAAGTVMPLAAMDLWRTGQENEGINIVRSQGNDVDLSEQGRSFEETEQVNPDPIVREDTQEEPQKEFKIGKDTVGDTESETAKATAKQEDENGDEQALAVETKKVLTESSVVESPENETIEDSLVIKALAQALQDEDWEVRKQAAWALGEMKDPSIVVYLTKAILDESNWQVREQLANSLGNMEDDRAVTALASIVTNDENWRVRMEAAQALGDIGSSKAIDALSKASSDANREVRREAVYALGEIHDTKAVEALILSLKDVDWEIRRRAAWSLGEIESHEAVEPLILALKDEHPEVRVEAVEALSQINDYRAVESLTAILSDENWEVREKAIEALGDMANSRSLEPLMKVLASDPNRDVRAKAAYTLGKIGDRRAVDPLIKTLSDEHWEVRERSAHALGDIRDAAATAALTRALKDENREVRSTAAWALGELR